MQALRLLGQLLLVLGINMKNILLDNESLNPTDLKNDGKTLSFTLEGKKFSFEVVTSGNGEVILQGVDGNRFKGFSTKPNREGDVKIIAAGLEGTLSSGAKKLKKSGAAAGSLTSPMPGKIFKIVASEGEKVVKGQTLLILEAMKMEHAIRSDKDGVVKKILFKVGELVQGGVTLIDVE